MASEVIAFPVNLRKNKNQYSTAYGKFVMVICGGYMISVTNKRHL